MASAASTAAGVSPYYAGGDMPNSLTIAARLVSDDEIAAALSVSRGWVRKQRFLRRHNQPHSFDVDPVMVGSLPRYRLDDVERWLASLTRPGGR